MFFEQFLKHVQLPPQGFDLCRIVSCSVLHERNLFIF